MLASKIDFNAFYYIEGIFSVHFIVDPHNDSSETEKYPPNKIFRQLVQLHANGPVARWSGIYGPDSVPSAGQWEELMQDCSMFIYYGMEKFISQVSGGAYSATLYSNLLSAPVRRVVVLTHPLPRDGGDH